MKYNGIELKEFTSDKPVVFDPPRKMVVWDCGDEDEDEDGEEPNPFIREVICFIPGRYTQAITMGGFYTDCAEIPEESKPRRATNREFAKWIAQGNGQWKNANGNYLRISTEFSYTEDTKPVLNVLVRKWGDTEWHEPTADYMGLDG